MDLFNQKRIAADILKCGLGRVRLDPTRLEDISEAVTREDIRRLIASGAIKARKKLGTSRVRARYRAAQRKKGRRRGHGHRKGGANARYPRKQRWIDRIRPIRRRLRELRDKGFIDSSSYRTLYRQAKGGMFHNRAHLETQLRLRGLLKTELPVSKKHETRRRRRREAARSVILPSKLEKVNKKEKAKRVEEGPGKMPEPAGAPEVSPADEGSEKGKEA
ncbi:MAG: 50S ribosomal protein L19e [Thermoplasmata archaeon]